MADYPSYKAPSLAPELAQLMNALSLRGRLCRFPFGIGEVELSLLNEAPSFEPACRISLMLDGHRWHAELSSSAVLLLHSAFQPETDGEPPFSDEAALPTEIRRAVLEDMLAPVLSELGRRVSLPASVDETAFAPLPQENCPFSLGFRADVPAPDHREPLTAFLRLSPLKAQSAAAAAAALRTLPICPSGSLAESVKSVPLEVTFESGYVFLTLSELSSLKVEDVLLPEVWTAPESLTLRIRRGAAPDLIALCTCADGQSVLNAAPSEETETAMNSQNDIDIRLSFELERRTITTGELEALSPGYTFAMNSEGQAPVTIRANGKAVARGRLVDMNGTLGVQITETL